MAAVFRKRIAFSIFSCLCFLLTSAGAVSVSATDEGKGTTAYALAKELLIKKHDAVSLRIRHCREARTVISADELDLLKLERETVINGLQYLWVKAHHDCYRDEGLQFIYAAKMVEFAAGERHTKDYPELEVNLAHTLLEDWAQELQQRAEYLLGIPLEAREKLEALEGVNQPFDLITSWRNFEKRSESQ
ncbi:MAG: hypothetical protein JJU06_03945 [Ectothiorhodospiraceae bacterium]|nr:hypothetical protein [Ectothiorhodospiraceae bacterium]MCH8504262.1 hypothetical protein [Ectothiorhodospiraceae bacterium]